MYVIFFLSFRFHVLRDEMENNPFNQSQNIEIVQRTFKLDPNLYNNPVCHPLRKPIGHRKTNDTLYCLCKTRPRFCSLCKPALTNEIQSWIAQKESVYQNVQCSPFVQVFTSKLIYTVLKFCFHWTAGAESSAVFLKAFKVFKGNLKHGG